MSPRKAVLAAVLGSALLLSCATLPRGLPDWVFSTPKPDQTYSYFVGQASTLAGTSVALDEAAANLVSGIVQYIGVKVDVDTSSTAKASLDSYAAEIRQTVSTQSSGRMAGFQIKERRVSKDRKTGLTTVYILASYVTADLEKEKARIAAVFKEREDAVSRPEAEARALAQEGRAYEALQKYIEAALAASGSEVDNAGIKLERDLAAVRGLVASMRFEKPAEPPKLAVGSAPSAPLRLRLLGGPTGGAGIGGAHFIVSYPRRQGSRLVAKTDVAVSDANGFVSFLLPAPDFVGRAKLSLSLDARPLLDLLGNLPASLAPQVALIEEGLRGVSIDLPYEVVSMAASVPTAVLILDRDEAGLVVAGGACQAGLVDALSRQGFALRGAGFGAEASAFLDDAAILEAARRASAQALPAAAYARLVYGSARLSAPRRDGASWLAEGRAQVKVVDLATGSILYSAERLATGIGSDEADSRLAAYRDLGYSAIAQDLLASLP
jgi:hypothetical protein